MIHDVRCSIYLDISFCQDGKKGFGLDVRVQARIDGVNKCLQCFAFTAVSRVIVTDNQEANAGDCTIASLYIKMDVVDVSGK